MKKFQVFGAETPEESQRERNHKALARRVAAEGFVLLKNDGVLPLIPCKIALYGPGSRRTIKGGSGSGDVHERHSVTIEEGLKNAGFSFPTTKWMDNFESKYQADIAAWRAQVEKSIEHYKPWDMIKMFDTIHEQPMPYPSCTPVLNEDLTDETDTAVYVLSRQAGEGTDRCVEKGDYLFSDIEIESLKLLSAHYKKLILILNCGSVMDLSILDETRIDAVLFFGQGGMEGGNSLADVLTGVTTPCGRLTDTWAYRYTDYPAADTFGHRNGNLIDEEYSEGIYVGYRWFSTKNILPRYPFGYGLSYTSFSCTADSIEQKDTKITVKVSVNNTGSQYSGKETVQIYLQKPDGAIDHEYCALATFGKTPLLAPGESCTLDLTFDLAELATFDELRSAFVLEAGSYTLLMGENVREAALCGTVALDKERIVEQVSFIGTNELLDDCKYVPSAKAAAALERLTDREKIMLVTGGGVSISAYNNVMGAAGSTTTKLLKKGVPNIVLADGPAGLNVTPATATQRDGTPRFPGGLPDEWKWGWLLKMEKLVTAKPGKGRFAYRYMTAWPSATLLAQTWDTALLHEVGCAIGREMVEIGVSVWLAPGMNIHRNPLCGRNFEYYSEDPLISGKMAAAITNGVQSVGGVGVSIKHFCCNNQEDNRIHVSSNVSQRALREIYLRAFYIAVTEGKPWTVMSCYNRVNGTYVCNSPDLLTHVLRKEWGYNGLVMSDWTATCQCSHAQAINAGNDLIMPGGREVQKALALDLQNGVLDKRALNMSASRVLDLIFKSYTCKDF